MGTTEEQFSAALDQELLADFERLYRTASDTSKDFLRFITLERELKAIKAALRRLAAGGRARRAGERAERPGRDA